MALMGGNLKRFLLTIIFLMLLTIVFVLLGGGNLLKTAGRWINGMGKKAENVKETIEQKASTIEKTVEKGIDTVKQGEKK